MITPILYADNFRQQESSTSAKISSVFFLSSLIDICLHPLHVAQSRFILQNRLPGFYSYKNFYQFFQIHYVVGSDLYKGCFGMIPINLVNSILMGLTTQDPTLKTFGISTFISTILTYPIYTAMRRYECQSSRPGMIPVRYKNIRHGLKLIATEEGIKGLYRGFSVHLAARLLEHLMVWIFLARGFRQNKH